MKRRIPLRPFLAGLAVLFLAANLNLIKYHLLTTKNLSHRNPTLYVFHVSEDRLIEMARAYSYDDAQQSLRQQCPNPEGLSVNRQYAQFFVRPGQRPNTTYTLTLRMEPPYWQKSETYFWRGSPLDYDADYAVDVTRAGDSMTEVSVQTTNAVVDIGPVFSVGDAGDLARRVAPTTVEEYRFLLTLGCIVGERGMPPLQLPRSSG